MMRAPETREALPGHVGRVMGTQTSSTQHTFLNFNKQLTGQEVRECVCETVRVHLVSLECLSNVNDSPGDQTDVTLTRSLSWERIDANVCWPLVAPAVTALCQSPGPDTDMISLTSEVTDIKKKTR